MSEQREVGLQKRVQNRLNVVQSAQALCPRQWTQPFRVWKSWQGLEPEVTLWHCQMVATERTFCTLAHLELTSRSTDQKKKNTHYLVQDHKFIGTWHWQRPLTTMVTIHTTSFNVEELYTLPLESVCVVFRSLRGRRGIFVHCLWQQDSSKGYCRMLASKLVTSEFMYRNNRVWIPSGLPAILCEVLFGLPSNIPGNAGKTKTNTQNNYKPQTQNTKKFVHHRQRDPVADVVLCVII